MRLAVTDRCNLRCFYCMPESGIEYMDRKDLLSFEEMERLVTIFSGLGIKKLRITGGEPFVRKGIMEFLSSVVQIDGIEKVRITTNGTFTGEKIAQLHRLGIRSVNLSLDSLDRERFFNITRRDLFETVMSTFRSLLDHGMEVKINMVVMEGRNIEDIYPMLELARTHPISVRFIEEMPFNGSNGQGNPSYWPAEKILDHIKIRYADAKTLEDPASSTAKNYKIPGFAGSFGVIAAYTRTFCGTCNRIRITPQGDLKTCLYDDGKISFREMLRSGASDNDIVGALWKALKSRFKDGFEAEKARLQTRPVSESMATIGG